MVGSAVLLAWVRGGELGHKRRDRTHLSISFLLNKVLERLFLSPRVTACAVRIAILSSKVGREDRFPDKEAQYPIW